jgi:6-phosphogluconate dehydrogenase
MLGGERADFLALEPLLASLAPANGYLHCGPVGAGHFVKMIHNGVEYALMEAYGEGFELMKASPFGGTLDLQKVAALWNQGSVVRSWILELLEGALSRDRDLSQVAGYVEDSGEGRWTVEQAVADGVDATSLAQALFKRFRSRQAETFSDKVIAALRHEFGGHAVGTAGPKPEGKR